MSLDESRLSALTQFFALLVAFLNVIIFAPDNWCESQCRIAFIWSYVSCVWCGPARHLHVQRAELGCTQNDITHAEQQTSI